MSNEGQFELYLWVLYAFGLGAMVGFEREVRGHEAGIRTNALVCAGAALFGLLGREIGEDRIQAAVVQGVGFLGAGLMFQREHSVRGVTTAATIWVLAGVGVIVAQEWWLTALLVAISIVIILELAPLSDWVLRRSAEEGAVRTDAVLDDDRLAEDLERGAEGKPHRLKDDV